MAVIKNMRKRHPSAGMLLDIVSISADIAHAPTADRTKPVGRVAGAAPERTAATPQMKVVEPAEPAKPELRLVASEPSPWDVSAEGSEQPATTGTPEPEPQGPPGGELVAFEVIDESTGGLHPHLRGSKTVNVISRLLQVICILYGAALLYWIWMAKDLSIGLVLSDPVFGTYSVLVTLYVLTRFCLAPFYRPTPDTGHRPSASIVIPAFNEEACIGQTVDACYAADYPDGQLEVVAVDDGSSDGTWEADVERPQAASEPGVHPVLTQPWQAGGDGRGHPPIDGRGVRLYRLGLGDRAVGPQSHHGRLPRRSGRSGGRHGRRPEQGPKPDHQDAAGPLLRGVPGDQGLRVDLRSGHLRIGLLLCVSPHRAARASSTGGRTSSSWGARQRTATTAR